VAKPADESNSEVLRRDLNLEFHGSRAWRAWRDTAARLMRELDIVKPQEAFGPPTIHIHFVKPGDMINE
jgi:hypothetical protein